MSLLNSCDSKIKASTLLETVMAMAILVICMSISITLFTSISAKKIRVSQVELFQHLQDLKQEIRANKNVSNESVFGMYLISIGKTTEGGQEDLVSIVKINVFNRDKKLLHTEEFYLE